MRAFFDADIDFKASVKFENLVHTVKTEKPKKIELCLDSSGGETTILGLLEEQVKDLEKYTDVTVVNCGQASSAAFEFFMSFKKRRMLDGAFFVLHSNKYSFSTAAPANQIDVWIDRGEKNDRRLWKRFFDNCNISEKDKRRIKRAVANGGDYVVYKEEAVKWGIVNA